MISVLDCLIKAYDSDQLQKNNWSILESHMSRSANFFKEIKDVTLLGLLLDRLVKISDKRMDIEELLEKAEICFLELIGYEASHSTERLQHLMANDPSIDIQSMSQIAKAFSLTNQGGPIYKCLDCFVEVKTNRLSKGC